ncbi:OmpA family protein [Tritonibacter sp. SIMBA_163]|uniref:OmpA family protein n=1 Tax=Tritonibacter sp. SIMBA_163 TaxID=3080868 RepID=UPI0039814542
MPVVFNRILSKACAPLACAATVVSLALAAPVAAQETAPLRGERYVPTIWVDPDGCEHWVMDDGAEGYMTTHMTPDGKPVCRRGQLCGMMPTDQFFATDGSAINAAGRKRLQEWFKSTMPGTRYFIVAGHTDSRASDEYNMALSKRRANAVAQVGRSVGARIRDIRAYGERSPRVPNRGAANRAQNRRVEIYCVSR